MTQKQMLYDGIQAVQQKRREQAAASQAQANSERSAVMGAKLQVATGQAMGPKTQGKPGEAGGKSGATKKAAGAANGTPAAKGSTGGSKVDPNAITPYLTAADLMEVSRATADAENTDSAAKGALDVAAANAYARAGDIGRETTHNVRNANDDAAARGIFKSGIRDGNVGMAQSAGVRGLTALDGSLKLAADQSIAARAAAKSQLGDFMTAMTARAAENGAALPVDPYQGQGANVPGAQTLKKRKVK